MNILELHRLHILYVRVSTEEQAKKGYSLDTQIDECRKKAIAEGADPDHIVVIKDDGYSGEFLERPGLDKLRNLVYDKRVASVTVYSLDRLGRVLDHLLLIDREVRSSKAVLQFVTETFDDSPVGQLFFAIRGAITQYEKAIIRERTMRGRRGKLEKGKLPNRPPFGYSYDEESGRWVINEVEAKVVRFIYERNIAGDSCVIIARTLSRQGFLNKQKKPFTDTHVWRILSSTTYVGAYYAFRQRCEKVGQTEFSLTVRPEEEWIQIEIPAIISTDVKLNAEIARDKNRTYSKRNQKNNYLLSGLLKCPACHCSMVGQANGRSGKYLYYACTSRTTSNRVNAGGMNRCDNKKYVPANELDEEVWNTLLDYARGNKDIEEILTGRAHGDKQSRAAEIGDIDNEIEAIKKQRETIRAAYRNHESTDAEYRQDMSITMKRLELLQARVAELRRSEIMVQRAAPAINPEDILNAKTFGEKRELLLRWGFIFLAERKENVSELSIMFKEDYDVLRGYKPAARWHYS